MFRDSVVDIIDFVSIFATKSLTCHILKLKGELSVSLAVLHKICGFSPGTPASSHTENNPSIVVVFV